MAEGKRPMGVGFFFSLGHSTVVFALAARLAVAAARVVALATIPAFQTTAATDRRRRVRPVPVADRPPQPHRAHRHPPHLPGDAQRRTTTRSGSSSTLTTAASSTGSSSAGVFRVITQPGRCIRWAPVRPGVRHGDRGRPAGALGRRRDPARAVPAPCSSLPVLFAAGMCLMDTTRRRVHDAGVRLGVRQPVRKIYYNITVTGLSVAIALLIGTVELVRCFATSSADGGVHGTG